MDFSSTALNVDKIRNISESRNPIFSFFSIISSSRETRDIFFFLPKKRFFGLKLYFLFSVSFLFAGDDRTSRKINARKAIKVAI